MPRPILVVSKETRKLWRLQTAEKYTMKRLDSTSFEVFTNDLALKAFGSDMGVIIFAKDNGNYSKIDVYKLQNYCRLLQKQFWGI